MYLIPLNQVESVDLVIHALRMAGGEADCSSCPARKVCMKQCLSIASAVQSMVDDGSLPSLGEQAKGVGPIPAAGEEEAAPTPKPPGSHLKVVK